MGYAATTIALYGIEIENTEENAPLLEKLSSMITDEEGYPAAKLYSIGHNQSKVTVAKESGLNWYVDDRYENFVDLNAAGMQGFGFIEMLVQLQFCSYEKNIWIVHAHSAIGWTGL